MLMVVLFLAHPTFLQGLASLVVVRSGVEVLQLVAVQMSFRTGRSACLAGTAGAPLTCQLSMLLVTENMGKAAACQAAREVPEVEELQAATRRMALLKAAVVVCRVTI